MKKCPHGREVLGLELTDFDLRTAIENALILVRERASRRVLTMQLQIGDRFSEETGE